MIDDTEQVGILDAGAVPATSTNTSSYKRDYYYTANEWSRQGMWGPLPDERNTELRGVKQVRQDDETSEENIKKL